MTVGAVAGSRAWRRQDDCFADQIKIAHIDRRPEIKAIAGTKLEPSDKLRSEACGRADEEWRRTGSERGEFVGALQCLAFRTTEDRHSRFDH